MRKPKKFAQPTEPTWYSVAINRGCLVMFDGFEVDPRPPESETLEDVMRRRGYEWTSYEIIDQFPVTWRSDP